MTNYYVRRRLSLEQRRAIPCRNGHSRQDAYAYEDPFTKKLSLHCKKCQKAQYKPVKVNKSLKHGLYRAIRLYKKGLQHEQR